MNTLYKYTRVMVLVLLSSGCSLLPQRRGSVTLYALTLSAPTESEAESDTRERSWQIEIAEPQAPAPLLGTRILVAPQPGRLEVYRDARWQDSPAILLQALLVQSLNEAGVTGAAGNASTQRADLLLESDLLQFQAEYRGGIAPTATTSIYVRLVRVADGRIVAARVFSVDEPAAASPVPLVVEAFERAINRLVRNIAAWVVVAGDRSGSPLR
jgi:cholesterol transport system auxiliary component